MKQDIINRVYDKSYDFLIETFKEGSKIYMGRKERTELENYMKIYYGLELEDTEDVELLGKEVIFVYKESYLEISD